MADISVDKKSLAKPLIDHDGDNEPDVIDYRQAINPNTVHNNIGINALSDKIIISTDYKNNLVDNTDYNDDNDTKSNKSNLWLGFDDIKLSVLDTKTKQTDKFILNGVSGQAFGGELYGIIGASGGGKTTLLSVISGRVGRVESLSSKCKIYGDVQLNSTLMNCSNISNFEYLRTSIAFVLQEDLLLPTELAREAIEVSAKLRLPKDMSSSDKLRKAHSILTALDLVNCSETKIGSVAIRGLSGGERKRVSIGIELVNDPHILMLDECTSGLDSAIAYQTILLLKKLANSGKMVIASLHQPSSEIFNCLDRVLILAKGKAIYEGKVSLLAEYLSSIGYECPRYTNLADFVLQKVSENDDFFISKWDSHLQNVDDKYKSEYTSIVQIRKKMKSKSSLRLNPTDIPVLKPHTMAPICSQLSVLMRRQFVIFIRDKIPTFARMGQCIFTAVLEGALWWRQPSISDMNNSEHPHEINTNLNNRFGAIFFAITFAAMNAIMVANLTFPSQRLVFQKERVGNWYYTTLWIAAKSIIDLPVTFLILLPFSLIVKYMVNFHSEFYELFIILSLVALVADSMGFLLGCVSKRPEVAMQLTPVTIIPLFLFSNFFVANKTMPVFLRWIQYIDCFYYGAEALAIYEFHHVKSKDGFPVGNDFLNIYFEPHHLKRDIYALIGLFIAFRIIAISSLYSKNGI